MYHTFDIFLFAANGTIQTQTVPSQVRGAAPNAQQQQIRLAAGGQPQQFVTLNGGQQVAVQMQPQVMQFPQSAQQTMVPVQIPVSQNGQTVYQTVQMPMAPAIQTAIVPQMIQTSAGQQIVMQQVQIAQPQIAQPQFAQILMPNGQLQQVQVIQQPQQIFTSIAGFPAAAAIQQHQQIPVQATAVISSSTATTASSATTVLSSPISSTSSSTSNTSPTTTTKMEPVIVKTEAIAADDQKSPNNMITLNGQQVVVQQPMTFNNAPAIQSASQIVSVRTANGQIVQVPAGAQVQQPPPTSTVHIPGIGAVQIMNAVPLGAANAGTTFTTPNGTAQIVNAAPQFANTQSQQALQQDPNDPTKWHVVQVATGIQPGVAQAANPVSVASQPTNQMTGVVAAGAAPQIANSQTTAQIVTANGTVIGSATIPANATTIATVAEGSVTVEGAPTGNSNGQQTKARLRRVACTCPNCKDGDRSRK